MTDFDPTTAPVPTGRSIILFHADADVDTIRGAIEGNTDARFSVSNSDDIPTHDGVTLLPSMKVAITELGGSALNSLAAADEVEEVRPEFFMWADCFNQRMRELAKDYMHDLVDRALAHDDTAPDQIAGAPEAYAEPIRDTADLTWGLQAIGVTQCSPTGKGVKVAVLDTGIDLTHPDFKDKDIFCQSFVTGQHVQDGNGHGTHVAGTIAGPRCSRIGRRYGIAPDVWLYIGKVLSDQGSGREFDVLAGIEWAINQDCDIISMSLGRAVRKDEKPDPLYERVGQVALDNGCLIIAAAGNESARGYGYIAPVGSPANASTIMAVAAVDPSFKVAPFSCGGINPGGGEVDIAAPGTGVYSAWPVPRQSRSISGTSMACPHVAGVAAVLAEVNPLSRGDVLWDELTGKARRLEFGQDYGSGLVQAPKGSW